MLNARCGTTGVSKKYRGRSHRSYNRAITGLFHLKYWNNWAHMKALSILLIGCMVASIAMGNGWLADQNVVTCWMKQDQLKNMLENSYSWWKIHNLLNQEIAKILFFHMRHDGPINSKKSPNESYKGLGTPTFWPSHSECEAPLLPAKLPFLQHRLFMPGLTEFSEIWFGRLQ